MLTFKEAHDLSVEVMTTMNQDCGPVEAEPYSGWAKQLAEYVIASYQDQER